MRTTVQESDVDNPDIDMLEDTPSNPKMNEEEMCATVYN